MNDKLANRIIKSQTNGAKKRRFKTNEKQTRRNNSNAKDSSFIISKRSVKYILQKQANIIGKVKEPYDY